MVRKTINMSVRLIVAATAVFVLACVAFAHGDSSDPVTVCKNVAWNSQGTSFDWRQMRIARRGVAGFLNHFPSYIACEGPCPCAPRLPTVCSLSHVLFPNGTEVFSVTTNSTEVEGYRWVSSERPRPYLTRAPVLSRPAYFNGSFVMTVTVVEEYGPDCVANITVDNRGDACPSDPNKTDPGLCGCGVSDSVVGHPCGTGQLGVCAVGAIQCSAGHQYCVPTNTASSEVCDGLDNDCDGSVDNNVPSASCSSDVGECTAGTTQCVSGTTVCQNAVGPTDEVCDGLDNDCNGIADDIPADICGSDVGECSAGTTQCLNGALVCANSVGPTTEVCDNLDNDCNGQIDNGLSGCGCVPQPEICDGFDNDCNGLIDDGIASVVCGSDVGVCSSGMTQCMGGVTVCTNSVGPSAETCDGLDNDCNGLVDDGIVFAPAICGSDVGACSSGTFECSNGVTVCTGAVGPTTEVCNGVDDDCDGVADNHIVPVACGSDVGECVSGMTQCSAGTTVCANSVAPTTDICDGLDNNCDGQVDEAFSNKGLFCQNVLGTCVNNGTYVCSQDGLTVVCSAAPVQDSGTCQDRGLTCGENVTNCGIRQTCGAPCNIQVSAGPGPLPTQPEEPLVVVN